MSRILQEAFGWEQTLMLLINFLSIIFIVISFIKSFTSFAFWIISCDLSLIYFITLHLFANSSEVKESKISLSNDIEYLKALINLLLWQADAETFNALPELASVDPSCGLMSPKHSILSCQLRLFLIHFRPQSFEAFREVDWLLFNDIIVRWRFNHLPSGLLERWLFTGLLVAWNRIKDAIVIVFKRQRCRLKVVHFI